MRSVSPPLVVAVLVALLSGGGALAGVLIERAGTSGTFLFTAGVALAGAGVLWARPAASTS
ncbi:hypothetical protein [Micromonospora sp. DT229]|uniref:hypothetical protein n=1 Tax=Micromonospora sp. DT229 TaxID=3393430 RepID=UPI003CEB735C